LNIEVIEVTDLIEVIVVWMLVLGFLLLNPNFLYFSFDLTFFSPCKSCILYWEDWKHEHDFLRVQEIVA